MALSGVDQTAVVIAYLREQESLRADRLFTDPWARHFVDASGLERPDPARTSVGRAGPRGASWTAVRTRFIDDALGDAAADCSQVVLLGAGLDTRALRLDWPDDTIVYEVDGPELHRFKDRVLETAGAEPGGARRVPVVADVTDGLEGALRAAGHDAARPTAWVAEGLLLYLSTEDNDRLVAELARLSPAGSRLVLTMTPPGQHARDDANADRGHGLRNPYRVSDGPEDPAAWLAAHGWRGGPRHPGRLAVEYGRTPSPEDAVDLPPRRHLVDAHRAVQPVARDPQRRNVPLGGHP